MKIVSARSKQIHASAMVTVMVFCGVLTVFVVSSLALVSNRNSITARSAGWNNAMPMAEAGIEEALTQLQYSTTNLETTGWTRNGGVYSKTRSNLVSDGFYTVTVQVTNASSSNRSGPTIISTGNVRAPMNDTYIARVVQVTTRRAGGHNYAMMVKNAVSISGGSIIDSFDSSDTNYSTGGQYVAAKAKANAIVASNSRSNNFAVGTGKIFGSVATGAGGTVTVGSSGAVGTAAYATNAANAGTIQPGHISHNQNEVIDDVTAPYGFGGGMTPSSGTWSGTNYTYALGTGDYWIAGLTIPGGGKMVITGKARLVVSGDFTISGSGFAYLAPGASLEIYVTSSLSKPNPTVTISGGGVANGTGNAANLYIGTSPAVKSVTYSGSSAFVGVLEAPQAKLTMSGSAAGVGALVADNIVFSGGMNFHYDESLGSGGKPRLFVTSWQEL